MIAENLLVEGTTLMYEDGHKSFALAVQLFDSGILVLEVRNKTERLEGIKTVVLRKGDKKYYIHLRIISEWTADGLTYYKAELIEDVREEFKRIFERTACNSKVYITIKEKKQFITAKAKDVSIGGMGAVGDVYIDGKTNVVCRFTLDTGMEFKLDGILLRSTPKDNMYRYAICFAEPDEDKMEKFVLEFKKHKVKQKPYRG